MECLLRMWSMQRLCRCCETVATPCCWWYGGELCYQRAQNLRPSSWALQRARKKMVSPPVAVLQPLMVTGFWDVMICSLVDICQRFGGICCLHIQGKEYSYCSTLKMEAADSSNIVNLYQTTQRHIPEDSSLLCTCPSFHFKSFKPKVDLNNI
jgi:hypothetical protein